MVSVYVFDKDYEVFVWGNRFSEGNITNLNTVQDWCRQNGAHWCFNEAFFNFVNGQNNKNNCSGRTLQYLANPDVGIIGYGDRTERLAVGKCIITGWKYAVRNGIQQKGLDAVGKRARNMDGLTADGRYIHVVSDRQTEAYVAAYALNAVRQIYGTTIKVLFVQDAGGSASVYSDLSRLSFYPEGTRKVASVMCVRMDHPYTFTRTLRTGLRGDDVRMLQMALGGIEIDGIFGAGTERRLKQAQRALGLAADGYAGPLTMRAMGYKFE